MNINLSQGLAIALIVLSALTAGSAQLADAGLSAGTVKAIVGLAGLAATIISGIVALLTGQASIIRQVSNMPGIEPLKINAQANQTVAALALDPANVKIDAKAGSEAAVTKIAQQG